MKNKLTNKSKKKCRTLKVGYWKWKDGRKATWVSSNGKTYTIPESEPWFGSGLE